MTIVITWKTFSTYQIFCQRNPELFSKTFNNKKVEEKINIKKIQDEFNIEKVQLFYFLYQ